ncbi:MAG: 2-C-methyl-D-erythritol 2,4-cyclodiphosphate synthase [Treponema sp.]|nr:2-C-methyl-D-erythritol 2,4-cyclodiphosphate synthase [Treponema sp.]
MLFTAGGNTRQESVYHALEALEPFSPDIVLIHDGARPFVDEKTITATLAAAERYGAAVPALLPADTIKTVNADNTVAQHLDRTTVRAVQTPQGFRFAPLLAAHRKAAAADRAYTDDSEIWGTFVGTVKLTAGSPENRKITYRSDIPDDTSVLPRIGFGYDLHRLVPGRKLLIGGVCIPAEKGEDAHSDGDVLLHAITDAVLGAAGCGDIGSYFPPTDMRWHNADSAQLLQTAWHDVQNAGWELGNIDAVIKLERPAFLPHRDAVRDSIAVLFSVPRDAIFVKAKTGEGLGDVGSGDAIEAWAHCLLFKRKHYRQETPSH